MVDDVGTVSKLKVKCIMMQSETWVGTTDAVYYQSQYWYEIQEILEGKWPHGPN